MKAIIKGAIVAVVVTGTMILTQCSKQEETTFNNDEHVQEKDFKIFNLISSFAQKMYYYKENPGFKNRESLDVDSALWLMEGSINLNHGFPFEEYSEHNTAKATVFLQKNASGRIDLNEVIGKYEQIVAEAREDYYNSGFEEKGLFVVNIEETEETDELVTLEIETITGNKAEDPYPFEFGDNWWYGEYGGGCAGNNQPGDDAAHELAHAYAPYKLNTDLAISGPKSVEVNGGEPWLRRPNDPLDNFRDYYIFCVQDNVEPFNYNDDLCLMASDMSDYFWYLTYVITTLAPVEFNIPFEYIFLAFDSNEGNRYFISPPQPGFYIYRHEYKLIYGLPFDKPEHIQPTEL